MPHFYNKKKSIKPILLEKNCLHCGRYSPIYDYCNFCIQPLLINNKAYCNYCKKEFTCLIDGHCTDCHKTLKKERSFFIQCINKNYIKNIIQVLGYSNYKELYKFIVKTQNNA